MINNKYFGFTFADLAEIQRNGYYFEYIVYLPDGREIHGVTGNIRAFFDRLFDAGLHCPVNWGERPI